MYICSFRHVCFLYACELKHAGTNIYVCVAYVAGLYVVSVMCAFCMRTVAETIIFRDLKRVLPKVQHTRFESCSTSRLLSLFNVTQPLVGPRC